MRGCQTYKVRETSETVAGSRGTLDITLVETSLVVEVDVAARRLSVGADTRALAPRPSQPLPRMTSPPH